MLKGEHTKQPFVGQVEVFIGTPSTVWTLKGPYQFMARISHVVHQGALSDWKLVKIGSSCYISYSFAKKKAKKTKKKRCALVYVYMYTK